MIATYCSSFGRQSYSHTYPPGNHRPAMDRTCFFLHLTANSLPVRDAAIAALEEQCAAMHTHSSKQVMANSERDSAGAPARPAPFFFPPFSPPPLPPSPAPHPPPPPPPPAAAELLPFPLPPLFALAAFAAAAAAFIAPEVLPSVNCPILGRDKHTKSTFGGNDDGRGASSECCQSFLSGIYFMPKMNLHSVYTA